MTYTLDNYQTIAVSLAKLIYFVGKKSNWTQHNYKNYDKFCLLGAMGHVLPSSNQRLIKPYLDTKLKEYVYSRSLVINTGKYELNLATFNDNVPHELLMAFLYNTYNTLIEYLDTTTNIA